MPYPYVEERDGNFYIGKSRVTLASIILYWKQGQTPEQIHEGFPTVPLGDIYGAITYYFEHQEEVEHYLRGLEQRWEDLRQAQEAARPEFIANMRRRLAEIRQHQEQEKSDTAPMTPESPTEETLESPTA